MSRAHVPNTCLQEGRDFGPGAHSLSLAYVAQLTSFIATHVSFLLPYISARLLPTLISRHRDNTSEPGFSSSY